MEAKTDAHSPQPIRRLGDLAFSVTGHHHDEPVLFPSQASTSKLLGPAVLQRTPYVLQRTPYVLL